MRCDVVHLQGQSSVPSKAHQRLGGQQFEGNRTIEGIYIDVIWAGVRRYISISPRDSWIKVMLTEDADELYKETRQWALQQKAEYQKVGLWHGKLRDRRQEIVFIGDKNAMS